MEGTGYIQGEGRENRRGAQCKKRGGKMQKQRKDQTRKLHREKEGGRGIIREEGKQKLKAQHVDHV